MKTSLYLLLITLSLIVSSCFYDCRDCLAPGEYAGDWLAYKDQEILVFESENHEIDSFIVTRNEAFPDQEFCGNSGSSHSTCHGLGVNVLYYINDTLKNDPFFLIEYEYLTEKGYDARSTITIDMDQLYFKCNNKGLNVETDGCTVAYHEIYVVNGRGISNVYHCYKGYTDPDLKITDFYYQKESGLLMYTTYENEISKTWTLKN